ncbi:MAG: hypothetical protein AMS27_08455 [Bacteroides sp. SM23_62_1]|nr:MAG: hypothetical protein AMS27_08455 [Bacteroides sp. SM23_62_1]
MADNNFRITYEIQDQTYTEDFAVPGSPGLEDIKLAARKKIRKKHPGVKYWEIRTISIEKI